MKSTGKKITVKGWEYSWREVPVMRAGKPTKRTKTVCVEKEVERSASSYLIEGHEVYIVDSELEAVLAGTHYSGHVYLYREDGRVVLAYCQYGRYGKADHKEAVEFNPKTEKIYVRSTGYNGPCGVGWGASVKRIDW